MVLSLWREAWEGDKTPHADASWRRGVTYASGEVRGTPTLSIDREAATMLFAEAEMDPQVQTIAILIGAVFAGAVCGLWPLSAGAKKGRPGVGMTGFLACVGSGFILGCLLALPMAIFFRLLIGVIERPAPPGGDGLGSEPFNPYANGKRSAF